MTDATKKASTKVFDISPKPTATPTSRPVITSHGPLMKDPTLVEASGDSDPELEKPETGNLLPKKEIKIEPPKEVEEQEPPKEEKIEPAAEADNKEPDSEPKAEESEGVKVEVKTIPKDEPKAESQPSTTPPQPITAKEEKKVPEEEAKVEIKTDTTPTSANEERKQEDAAAAAALAHAQHINELVTNKKYFLPINQVEKKKNRRVVVVGIILCVILAIAWVDVALDAGIISNTYHLPHTHFFAVKP